MCPRWKQSHTKISYEVVIASTDERSNCKLEAELCHIKEQLKNAENHIEYLSDQVATYRQRWLEAHHHADNLEHHMPYGVYVPNLDQIPEDTASPKFFPEYLTGSTAGSEQGDLNNNDNTITYVHYPYNLQLHLNTRSCTRFRLQSIAAAAPISLQYAIPFYNIMLCRQSTIHYLSFFSYHYLQVRYYSSDIDRIETKIQADHLDRTMSKRAGSGGDEPTAKRLCRFGEVNQTVQSALYDNGAWEILKQFLTTSMSLSEMDDALVAYLGDRYSEDDWVEPRHLLFSGDDDNVESLRVLMALWKTYIPDPPKETSVRTSASRMDNSLSGSRINTSRKPSKVKNIFILDEAEDGDDEEDEYGEGDDEEDGDEEGTSVRLREVTRLQGPSAKQRLAATFDDMASWFETNSSQNCWDHAQRTPESRMYLLDIQRTVTDYVADHLRKKKFLVTLSAWVAGQLYVVADSPKTIADSLPLSLYIAVKRYTRIMDDERRAVERSRTTLPNPAWVRIKNSKHKGSIGRVFKSGQDTVEILFPTCNFPYPMPRGCRALVERSRLLNDNSVSDIILNDEVVGWTFKGESYYMGLLLKSFQHNHLELLASPHVDDIKLHLESGWDKPFLKKTIVVFSMQFLRVGDQARAIKGALRGELGEVISTDHTCGSVGLEFTLDECPEEIEVRLQDIERVFHVGDTVRVVAGPYLGLEGHVLQMCEDVFHVCQAVSKEVVEVSKYYLNRHPLSHTCSSYLPVLQYFEPPPDTDTIEIGDFIEVLDGEHTGRCGVVDWLSKGDDRLWFRDFFTPVDTESAPSSISVPIAMVQRTDIAQTIQYTRERGYDVKPGDIVNVACGPDYGARGIVHSVDFPNGCLTLLCDGDRSLIDVQIRFVIKLQNVSLDYFKKDIGQEVFVIRGDRKGYRGTLHSLNAKDCIIAIHGQQRTKFELQDVVTKYGMKLTGAMLEGSNLISFCDMQKRSYVAPPPRSVTPPVEAAPSGSSASITDPGPSSSNGWVTWSASTGDIDAVHDPASSINPSSSISDPWTIDRQESIDPGTEKLPDSGPLPWLMTKEFSSKFLSYHVVLKVSPSFMGGRLSKRFVLTASPDPFCGENGPAPEGSVAAFCTSNSAGAAIQHYHIPASELSPAPPHKKNQHQEIKIKIKRANDQYCANLGMKINSKCGDPSVASLAYSFDRRAARHDSVTEWNYNLLVMTVARYPFS
ncbi:hypothetical protein EDD22DRAFT_849956 [Suillus occidentalis]|nr:hypothetical protein EDD22DRAFT_849956 [Suillus occidentalis]